MAPQAAGAYAVVAPEDATYNPTVTAAPPPTHTHTPPPSPPPLSSSQAGARESSRGIPAAQRTSPSPRCSTTAPPAMWVCVWNWCDVVWPLGVGGRGALQHHSTTGQAAAERKQWGAQPRDTCRSLLCGGWPPGVGGRGTLQHHSTAGQAAGVGTWPCAACARLVCVHTPPEPHHHAVKLWSCGPCFAAHTASNAGPSGPRLWPGPPYLDSCVGGSLQVWKCCGVAGE